MRQEPSALVLEKRARYLLSIACLVKDVARHDELQQKAQELFARARTHGTHLFSAPVFGICERILVG
jgi:hypothetical protein